jgi:Big-like domain-containing protein
MLQFRTNTPALFINAPLSGAGAKPDTTGPDITIIRPLEGAVYKINEQVVASYSCTDVSGVVGCEGAVASGAAAETSTVGTKAFVVTAIDTAGNQAMHTVTYTVVPTVTASNAAPVAHEQAVSVPQNTSMPITLAASDANGDSLTYIVVTSPTHGTLTGTAPNLTYTPTPDYLGTESFTFKANDGKSDSNAAIVSSTVVHGTAMTFRGAGVNSATGTALSAEATLSFDPNTMYLTVELTNTSFDDVSWPQSGRRRLCRESQLRHHLGGR